MILMKILIFLCCMAEIPRSTRDDVRVGIVYLKNRGKNTMAPFDRLLKTMLRPWVVVCYLSFMILSFLYFDQPIARFFYGMDLRDKLPFIAWITRLGTGEFYIAGLFLLALFYRYIRPNGIWEIRGWFLWLCVVIPYLICGVLKVCLGRARPELLFDHQLYGFYGPHFINYQYWSFPSGHTTTIMGLVFGLIILFPRYCYAFFFPGLLLVSTRIILTNHYLSDVLTTGYLTFLEVALVLFVLRRKEWLTSAWEVRATARVR